MIYIDTAVLIDEFRARGNRDAPVIPRDSHHCFQTREPRRQLLLRPGILSVRQTLRGHARQPRYRPRLASRPRFGV